MSGIDELARGLAEPVATPWLRPAAFLAFTYLAAITVAYLIAGGWAAPVAGATVAMILDRRVP
jgi:hypothetical protein